MSMWVCVYTNVFFSTYSLLVVLKKYRSLELPPSQGQGLDRPLLPPRPPTGDGRSGRIPFLPVLGNAEMLHRWWLCSSKAVIASGKGPISHTRHTGCPRASSFRQRAHTQGRGQGGPRGPGATPGGPRRASTLPSLLQKGLMHPPAETPGPPTALDSSLPPGQPTNWPQSQNWCENHRRSGSPSSSRSRWIEGQPDPERGGRGQMAGAPVRAEAPILLQELQPQPGTSSWVLDRQGQEQMQDHFCAFWSSYEQKNSK